MPGFIKIGKTESDLANRIRSLNSTSVPFDFECYYAARVNDAELAEKLLHDAFADQRPNPRREFFTLDPERAKSALRLAALEDVTPGLDQIIPDVAERAAVANMAKQRRQTSLEDIGLQPGTVLILDRDATQTCEVADRRKVRYRGELLSPSAAALLAIRACGYDWPSANGWQHWTYNGRPLKDWVSEHLSE